MKKRILITGGAGFVGSHLADALLEEGHEVRALDSLSPQVHGEGEARPPYLSPDVELIVGDVRNHEDVRRALEGIDVVYHLAAAVGVGQSMYQIREYTAVNNVGTAVLLEEIGRRPIERLIVASSMSIYGEGLYQDPEGRIRSGGERARARLRRADWELYDEEGRALVPVPTPESKVPTLASVYALSKYDQERLCLLIGAARGVPTVALRFFNIYGTRQALSNPYTGVLAIFAARLLNDRPPLVFEDGLQMRDFVSVRDVARASVLALGAEGAVGHAINVGSGDPIGILEVARRMAEALGKDIEPEVTGKHRVGDIRHCFADTRLARELLGFVPRVGFEEGLVELAEWLEGQVARDEVGSACEELATRGFLL